MTPHLDAKKGQIAKKILLPGDPLRAKFIAENYLTDSIQFNFTRNVFGYTGLYKGSEVSVLGTGMGIPSMAIYVSELIDVYGVEDLIRIGSCGAYSKDLKLNDLIIASSASTDSNFAYQFGLDGHISASPDFSLLLKAYNVAEELAYKTNVGPILTSDVFYDYDDKSWTRWRDIGILAVEMETYVLYLLSQIKKVRALSILTVSDSLVDDSLLDSSMRERSLTQMIEIGLESLL